MELGERRPPGISANSHTMQGPQDLEMGGGIVRSIAIDVSRASKSESDSALMPRPGEAMASV